MNKNTNSTDIRDSIVKIINIAYNHAKQSWSGQQCLGCTFMNQLQQHLIHLQFTNLISIFKKKMQQLLLFKFKSKQQNNCLNKICYDKVQGIDHLKKQILKILQQKCQFQNLQNKNHTLNDINSKILCFCIKCISEQINSSKTIISESTTCQQNQIKQSLNKILNVKFEEQKKCFFQKTSHVILNQYKQKFDQLKKQRKIIINQNLKLFGNLLGIDQQKYIKDFTSEPLQKQKKQFYDQLINKNVVNLKMIKRFTKEVNSKEAIQKMKQKPVTIIHTNYIRKTFTKSNMKNHQKVQTNQSIKQSPKTSKLFQIRNKAKLNNVELPIKQKFDDPEVFVSHSKHVNFRINQKDVCETQYLPLNRINFDPNNMFYAYNLQRDLPKNSENFNLRGFSLKSKPQRLLFKVGGGKIMFRQPSPSISIK